MTPMSRACVCKYQHVFVTVYLVYCLSDDQLGCGFLFAFHSNYGRILYHFGDKSRYWSKIAFFIALHSTPPLGGSRRNGCHVLYGKPEWCGYPTVKKVLMILIC